MDVHIFEKILQKFAIPVYSVKNRRIQRSSRRSFENFPFPSICLLFHILNSQTKKGKKRRAFCSFSPICPVPDVRTPGKKNDRKISCRKIGLNILFICKHFVNIVVYIIIYTILRESDFFPLVLTKTTRIRARGCGIDQFSETPGSRARSSGSAKISASARSIASSQVM